MPLTAKDFRRMALAMTGASEGAHMGHPDFRVNGTIFATLQHGMKTGMVKLTPEQQERFLRERVAGFMSESGAWGRGGCTRVVLDAIDEESLGEAMTLAFQNIAGAKPAATKRVRRPAATGITMAAAMKMGAALPDVERTTTWGAPTLKLRGKMLACQAVNKSAEPNTLVVRVPFAQRDELLAADPDTYYLKPHYEDYPSVLVRLSRIHPDALRDLLRMGWEFTNTQAARKRARPAAKKTRRG